MGAGLNLKEEAVLRAGSAGAMGVFSGLGGKSGHVPLLGDELTSVAALRWSLVGGEPDEHTVLIPSKPVCIPKSSLQRAVTN